MKFKKHIKISLNLMVLISPILGCTTSGDSENNPNDHKCEFKSVDDTDKKIAVYSQIINNEIVIEKCKTNQCNTEGTKCVEPVCEPEQRQCIEINGEYIEQKCGLNYLWENGKVCHQGCEGTKCKDECSADETKCEVVDGKPTEFKCENGDWSTSGTACESGIGCNLNGTACGVCKNNDQKCEDNALITCREGTWLDPVACDDEHSCNAEGTACGVCKNGAIQNNGIQNEICENGAWKFDSCVLPYFENEGNCVECTTSQCLNITQENIDSIFPAKRNCEIYKEIVLKLLLMDVTWSGFSELMMPKVGEDRKNKEGCKTALTRLSCETEDDWSMVRPRIKWEAGIAINMACNEDLRWSVNDSTICSSMDDNNIFYITKCQSQTTCELE